MQKILIHEVNVHIGTTKPPATKRTRKTKQRRQPGEVGGQRPSAEVPDALDEGLISSLDLSHGYAEPISEDCRLGPEVPDHDVFLEARTDDWLDALQEPFRLIAGQAHPYVDAALAPQAAANLAFLALLDRKPAEEIPLAALALAECNNAEGFDRLLMDMAAVVGYSMAENASRLRNAADASGTAALVEAFFAEFSRLLAAPERVEATIRAANRWKEFRKQGVASNLWHNWDLTGEIRQNLDKAVARFSPD